jgi:hypothetical protein
MKKTLAAACIALVIASAAFAVGVPTPSNPRPMVDAAGTLLSDDAPLPTKDSLGGSPVSSSNPVPAYDARGSVSTGTPYYANLSTSTPTLLSAIASWSAHDVIEIQCNNVAFRSPLATTTAATVWKAKRVGQYDIITIIPSESSLTWNMSWIASSSANASISVDVYPPRP